jgi:hypothetical protein
MSVIGAAVVPSPPLLARELTGRQVVLPELREACAVAVGRLLAGSPAAPADVVAVVGGGPVTATWEPEDRLNHFAWGPVLAGGGAGGYGTAGGARPAAWDGTGSRTAGKPGLPLALGIGARLLDEAGYAGPRVLQAVSDSAPAQECLAVGAAVAALAPRVALLVVGDGSARSTPAAPGYFDERSGPFGAAVETALRAGDMAALAGLDAALAGDLMATGRAAWQVLAGAVGLRRRVPGDVLYAGAPFGVAYYVSVLDPR